MNPFFVQPTECLLVSSEDIYTMSIPQSWIKFLAFNKPVPRDRVPASMGDGVVYLASVVLPMGFLNSVSLAQHVHRQLVLKSGQDEAFQGANAAAAAVRKDRSLPTGQALWRVYLDNYDLLEKVQTTDMVSVQGTPVLKGFWP